MTFKWQGKVYDTSEMQSFTTSNPVIPVLCLAPDRQSVFVVRIDRVEGVEVHLADAAESHSLATQYRIPGLLAALGGDATPPASPDQSATKWRVLIVEDDASSRHALGRLLKLSGYEVATAATVSEATGRLNEGFGSLILDLNLPDGHGTVLLESVRDSELPMRVAVTTASTDPDLLHQAAKLRPDAVFRKPLDLSELVGWLDAA